MLWTYSTLELRNDGDDGTRLGVEPELQLLDGFGSYCGGSERPMANGDSFIALRTIVSHRS